MALISALAGALGGTLGTTAAVAAPVAAATTAATTGAAVGTGIGAGVGTGLAAGTAGAAAGAGTGSVLGSIGSGLSSLGSSLASGVSSAASGIGSVGSGVINGGIGGGLEAVGGLLNTAGLEGIGGAVSTVGEGVSAVTGLPGAIVGEVLEPVIGGIEGGLNAIGLAEPLAEIGSNISGYIEPLTGAVDNFFAIDPGATNTLQGVGQNALKAVSETVGNTVNAPLNAVNSLSDQILTAPGRSQLINSSVMDAPGQIQEGQQYKQDQRDFFANAAANTDKLQQQNALGAAGNGTNLDYSTEGMSNNIMEDLRRQREEDMLKRGYGPRSIL